MKIGIFDPYLDDLGGGEKYMMTIASCLSKKHNVSVFWDNPEDLKGIKDRFSLDLSGVNVKKNIFTDNVPFIRRLMTTRFYDVLIILSDGSIPLTFSKKLFVHIQQPLSQFQNNSLKDRIKLARISSFFCNSYYTSSFIDKFGITPVIIYPPVILKPKRIKKENIILHVGRFRVKNVRNIDDYKKQAVMIGVFKKLVDNGLKNWKFVIAVSFGDREKKDFKNLVNIAKNYPIEFETNRKNDEIWDLYSKAKIYWHASGFGEDLVSHPEFAEHFGISTVEAMGGGAVPIVINAGGQIEIVENGKSGFLWDTLEDLSKKTLNLIEDEKLRITMSEQAKGRAKNFSDENFCQKINDLING